MLTGTVCATSSPCPRPLSPDEDTPPIKLSPIFPTFFRSRFRPECNYSLEMKNTPWQQKITLFLYKKNESWQYAIQNASASLIEGEITAEFLKGINVNDISTQKIKLAEAILALEKITFPMQNVEVLEQEPLALHSIQIYLYSDWQYVILTPGKKNKLGSIDKNTVLEKLGIPDISCLRSENGVYLLTKTQEQMLIEEIHGNNVRREYPYVIKSSKQTYRERIYATPPTNDEDRIFTTEEIKFPKDEVGHNSIYDVHVISPDKKSDRISTYIRKKIKMVKTSDESIFVSETEANVKEEIVKLQKVYGYDKIKVYTYTKTQRDTDITFYEILYPQAPRISLFSLSQKSAAPKPEIKIEIPQKISLGIQIYFYLQFLHELQIIHCDLNPKNIIVEWENYANGLAVIVDLGTAMFEKRPRNIFNNFCARSYVAPEIKPPQEDTDLLPSEITPSKSSDVFSLTLCLTSLLLNLSDADESKNIFTQLKISFTDEKTPIITSDVPLLAHFRLMQLIPEDKKTVEVDKSLEKIAQGLNPDPKIRSSSDEIIGSLQKLFKVFNPCAEEIKFNRCDYSPLDSTMAVTIPLPSHKPPERSLSDVSSAAITAAKCKPKSVPRITLENIKEIDEIRKSQKTLFSSSQESPKASHTVPSPTARRPLERSSSDVSSATIRDQKGKPAAEAAKSHLTRIPPLPRKKVFSTTEPPRIAPSPRNTVFLTPKPEASSPRPQPSPRKTLPPITKTLPPSPSRRITKSNSSNSWTNLFGLLSESSPASQESPIKNPRRPLTRSLSDVSSSTITGEKQTAAAEIAKHDFGS